MFSHKKCFSSIPHVLLYVTITQFEILSNSLRSFFWTMERGKIKLLKKSQWWHSPDLYCSLEQKEKSGTLVCVHSVVSDSLLKKCRNTGCYHYLKFWSFVPYGVLALILIFLNTILKYHFLWLQGFLMLLKFCTQGDCFTCLSLILALFQWVIGKVIVKTSNCDCSCLLSPFILQIFASPVLKLYYPYIYGCFY